MVWCIYWTASSRYNLEQLDKTQRGSFSFTTPGKRGEKEGECNTKDTEQTNVAYTKHHVNVSSSTF